MESSPASALQSNLASKLVRWAAALLCCLAAAIYLLIAAGVVTVSDPGAGEDKPTVIMALASASFILGAVILLAVENWILYALGALWQLVVIAGYFAIAPSRNPSFEFWGIVVKVAQVLVLAALAYLLTMQVHGRRRSATAETRTTRAG